MVTKPVIYIVVASLLIGGSIGVGVGYFVFGDINPSTEKRKSNPKPKRIIVEKPVYIEKESNSDSEMSDEVREEKEEPANDTIYVITENGTLPADTNDVVVVNHDSITPEGIIVRKEQLVRTFEAPVAYLTDTGSLYASAEDSTFMEHLDIRPEFETRAYEVEVWSSPLNFRGYRLGKKKLLLYGMEFVRDIELAYLDDILYLKAEGNLFRLRKSEDFLPYEKVVDREIIARLNQ